MEHSAPPGNQAPPAIRVDRQARIVELDESWDARAELHGCDLLGGESLLDRRLWQFLDRRRVEVWRGWFESLGRREGPPAVSADPILRRLRPWPAAGGYWIRLDLGVDAGFSRWLAQPLLQVHSGRLVAINAAGGNLLENLGGEDDLRHFEAWLSSRQPPLRMIPVPDLRLGGKPCFITRQPSPFDIGAFSLLARAVRSALHDLSNPLAAMRMMAEIAIRTDTEAADPAAAMRDMATYLDQTIQVVHGLRSLIHADSAVQELDAESEIRGVAALLRSELERRELALRISRSGEGHVVAGAGAFRLLVAGGILSSCERAGAGEGLHLHLEDHGQAQLLTCAIEGDPLAPPPKPAVPDPILFERLAHACDGQVRVAPGQDESRRPDWKIELGVG